MLEIYGKFRSGHDVKLKEAENLARVLEPLDVTLGMGRWFMRCFGRWLAMIRQRITFQQRTSNVRSGWKA